MRVLLVGADLEENLGLGMIAASLRAARHRVDVVSFNESAEAEAVARRVLAKRPRLVGLGIQFQHRAHDFLALARRLRQGGRGKPLRGWRRGPRTLGSQIQDPGSQMGNPGARRTHGPRIGTTWNEAGTRRPSCLRT